MPAQARQRALKPASGAPAQRREPALRRASRTKRNAGRLAAIAVFLVVYLAAVFFWRVPVWLAGVYGLMSVVAFAAYAVDKSAAQSGGKRISENTLLMLGLVGGWPGAIIAQQLLHHKSSKASFRAIFWFTAAVNVAAFLFLASPAGRLLLRW